MSSYAASSPTRPWKGKARARPPIVLARQQEGSGGEAGVVLALDMLQTSAYEAVYTVPLLVGDNQNLSVQIDTGSSDLWIASTSCTTQACKQTGGRLYDPSQSTPTNIEFDIDYVEGSVEGAIVWDTVQIGGYSIDDQALAAASTVDSEPLSWDFDGVLGLALSANSVISQRVPAQFSNAPDGAVLASNLFSISPVSSAPDYRFISLSLERPGSDDVPSRLGIGRHPSFIQDPSKVEYAQILSSSNGPTFWEGNVYDISVYVNGQPKSIALGASVTDGGTPTAVIDSGMPIILASLNIANGIYGALGIGPASDGQYYLPCTTPINMTVTLDNRTAIALHPLDLSTPNSASSCLGLIQSFSNTSDVAKIADIILGVPFMRSAYTVMAYDIPSADGAFPSAAHGTGATVALLHPNLGLLGLTNATVALDEFHTVRVLNEPLPSTAQTTGGAAASSSGKKLSVGVEVLIGLVGFFALCVALFCTRWLMQRRRIMRARAAAPEDDSMAGEGKDGYMMQDVAYQLARRSSYDTRYGPSEETIRARKFAEYARRTEVKSVYTDESARTRVAEGDVEADEADEKFAKAEMGYHAVQRHSDSYSEMGSPRGALLDPARTLVGSPPFNPKELALGAVAEYPPSPSPTATHQRLPSGEVALPLLAHMRSDSHFSLADGGRVPLGLGRPAGRARVGSIGSAKAADEERRLSASSVHSRSSGTVGTLPRLAGVPNGLQSPPHLQPYPYPHPLSPPPLLNLGPNDASQLSVSAETADGHIF